MRNNIMLLVLALTFTVFGSLGVVFWGVNLSRQTEMHGSMETLKGTSTLVTVAAVPKTFRIGASDVSVTPNRALNTTAAHTGRRLEELENTNTYLGTVNGAKHKEIEEAYLLGAASLTFAIGPDHGVGLYQHDLTWHTKTVDNSASYFYSHDDQGQEFRADCVPDGPCDIYIDETTPTAQAKRRGYDLLSMALGDAASQPNTIRKSICSSCAVPLAKARQALKASPRKLLSQDSPDHAKLFFNHLSEHHGKEMSAQDCEDHPEYLELITGAMQSENDVQTDCRSLCTGREMKTQGGPGCKEGYSCTCDSWLKGNPLFDTWVEEDCAGSSQDCKGYNYREHKYAGSLDACGRMGAFSSDGSMRHVGCCALVLFGGGGCFPAGAEVTLRDGSPMRIEDLLPGTEVLAIDDEGKSSFDTVLFLTHAFEDQQALTQYLKITTATGHELELTPNHKLFVDGCCSEADLRSAEDVRVGDELRTVDGISPVVEIQIVMKQGHYNAGLKNSHQIVVNGVATTYHTTEWSFATTEWVMNFLRAFLEFTEMNHESIYFHQKVGEGYIGKMFPAEVAWPLVILFCIGSALLHVLRTIPGLLFVASVPLYLRRHKQQAVSI